MAEIGLNKDLIINIKTTPIEIGLAYVLRVKFSLTVFPSKIRITIPIIMKLKLVRTARTTYTIKYVKKSFSTRIRTKSVILSIIEPLSNTVAIIPNFHFDFLWNKKISMEKQSRILAKELFENSKKKHKMSEIITKIR